MCRGLYYCCFYIVSPKRWDPSYRHGFALQLAAEVVYLEALVSVVRANPVPDPRPLDSTVINWMLRHQEFVPNVTDPDVKRLRDTVLDLSAQLWGLVSIHHLQHVQRRLLEELRVCGGCQGIPTLCRGRRPS